MSLWKGFNQVDRKKISDHAIYMKRVLRMVVEGNVCGIPTDDLRVLSENLHFMTYFFSDTDNAMTFYLSQKQDECEKILKSRIN